MVWLQIPRMAQSLGASLDILDKLEREFITGVDENALSFAGRLLHDWALALVLMLPTFLEVAVFLGCLLYTIERRNSEAQPMSQWIGQRPLHSLLVENIECASKLMLMFGMSVSLLCIFSAMLVLTQS